MAADDPSVAALVLAVLPEGTARPDDVPAPIFDAALRTVLALRRLDMRSLAADLGIGRATLYRKVGDRDALLGAVLWYFTRHWLVRALRTCGPPTGVEHLLAVTEAFLTSISGQPALRRLLDSEPEAALRVLTSKHGVVQGGLVAALERLLAVEEEASGYRPPLERRTLAYVVVRIGESFLYADVIADSEPDVGAALTVIAQLVREQPAG